MQIEYEDYQNLIFQLAHRFNKTTGIELEELISCGNLEFVRCQETFDPLMASFCTYLTIKIKGLFLSMAAKERRKLTYGVFLESVEEKIVSDIDVEKCLIFKNGLKKLSNDAQIVVQIVFDMPRHLIENIIEEKQTRVTKGHLYRYLRKWGWKCNYILEIFKEIQKHLGIKNGRKNRNIFQDFLFLAPNGQPTNFRRKGD